MRVWRTDDITPADGDAGNRDRTSVVASAPGRDDRSATAAALEPDSQVHVPRPCVGSQHVRRTMDPNGGDGYGDTVEAKGRRSCLFHHSYCVQGEHGMVQQSSNSPALSRGRSAPLSIAIAGFAVLAVILGALAWHFLGSQSAGAPARALTATEQANQEWVQQQAVRTHGDITKIEQEEQRKLYAILGPEGRARFLAGGPPRTR